VRRIARGSLLELRVRLLEQNGANRLFGVCMKFPFHPKEGLETDDLVSTLRHHGLSGKVAECGVDIADRPDGIDPRPPFL